MSMYDFGNEQEQKEHGSQGLVPGGSIVIVRMEALEPDPSRQAREDRYISIASSGLRQLYCKFEVSEGQYAGVWWRQNMTLPCGMQKIPLQPNQEKACNIGGAMLKAILESAGKPLLIQSFANFTGLKFPARVKISNRPFVADNGNEYWRNEIATIITPKMEDFATVKKQREIIVDGPVTGNPSNAERKSSGAAVYGSETANYDVVPF